MQPKRRLVPGSLAQTYSDTTDDIFSSVFSDSWTPVYDTMTAFNVTGVIAIVLAVSDIPSSHSYHRTYVLSPDCIGWVLLHQDEVIYDYPAD